MMSKLFLVLRLRYKFIPMIKSRPRIGVTNDTAQCAKQGDPSENDQHLIVVLLNDWAGVNLSEGLLTDLTKHLQN